MRLFETLKIYSAEETEARQEVMYAPWTENQGAVRIEKAGMAVAQKEVYQHGTWANGTKD